MPAGAPLGVGRVPSEQAEPRARGEFPGWAQARSFREYGPQPERLWRVRSVLCQPRARARTQLQRQEGAVRPSRLAGAALAVSLPLRWGSG